MKTPPFAALLGNGMLVTSLLSVAACTSEPLALPAPAVSLEVAGLASSVPAGVAAFTVTAKDASGRTATGYAGTVHFTSTDPVAALPADYAFVGADAGSHAFAVTFRTAGTQTVTATDKAASSITGSAQITVTPGVAATLAVAGLASSVPAGVAALTFTVTAKDPFGNTATGYTGTVHFTSTDPLAVLPTDYAFVSADAGSHGFAVFFMTAGSQTVTAIDKTTSSITGSAHTTVTPVVAARLEVGGLPCNIVVTATDAVGDRATGYTGTVHFTSTDPLAVLPADYAFVSADASSHTFPVTLKTAGTQTVTASDFRNSLTGSEAVTVNSINPDQPLYVANPGFNSVFIYAAGLNCPSATISGSNTGLRSPSSIARDAVGRLYVLNSGNASITVYAPGATGNATPTPTLAGSNTGLSNPGGIALDAAGRLYVTNVLCDILCSGSITVYAAGATGNATPTATISGSNIGLSFPRGIALDAAGRLYVANSLNCDIDGCNDFSITVYAAGATGNATPIATIQGSNTGLNFPRGIALDAAGRLYVSNNVGNGGDCLGYVPGGSITVYAAGATGNVTPTATIAGSNTGLNYPDGIALDAAGRLYVANGGSCGSGSSITVYAAGATGNATPIATIQELNSPWAITF